MSGPRQATLTLPATCQGAYASATYSDAGGGIVQFYGDYSVGQTYDVTGSEMLGSTFFSTAVPENGGNPFFLPLPLTNNSLVSRPLINVRGRLCMAPLLSAVIDASGALAYSVDTSNQTFPPPSGKTAKSITFSIPPGWPSSYRVSTIADNTGEVVGFQETGPNGTFNVIFGGLYPFGGDVYWASGNTLYSTWTYSETDPASILMGDSFLYSVSSSSYSVATDSILVTASLIPSNSVYLSNGLDSDMPVSLCNNSVACLRTLLETTIPTGRHVRAAAPSENPSVLPSTVLQVYGFPTAGDSQKLLGLPSGTLVPLLRAGMYIGLDGMYSVLLQTANTNFGIIQALKTPVCNEALTQCLSVPLYNKGTLTETLTAALYQYGADLCLGFCTDDGNPILSTLQTKYVSEDYYAAYPVIGTFSMKISATEQYSAVLQCVVLQSELSLVLNVVDGVGIGPKPLVPARFLFTSCPRVWFRCCGSSSCEDEVYDHVPSTGLVSWRHRA